MKTKLLTLIALLGYASVASALSFNWNISGTQTVEGSDVSVSINTASNNVSFTIYRATGDLTKVDNFIGALKDQDVMDGSTITSTTEGAAGSADVVTMRPPNTEGTFNVGDGLWTSFTLPDGIKEGDVFYVVIADHSQGGNNTLVGQVTYNGVDGGGFDGAPTGTDWPQFDVVWKPGWNGVTHTTPEPTAMALLLMGAAALGLRRKVRS